ncbi:response regulator transcription factor [Cohnella silvisoli]|uniref:Response regulator n=1 Tax=Cohnella silvisoli TaxID=2873699 RepID=A0ABV1KP99_9BACL|nr:response regulator [Cohnella silvisoli]MCD9020382.1 response regulator [Cohnella silvisoli]
MNVLIVDDEDTILTGLAALIAELPEVDIGEIYSALSGSEALNILSSCPIGLVITDIHMPGIDGLSLTGTIRYRHPDIPVVLLTGYNDSSYLQQAIRLKAEDYLFKPVKEKDLLNMFERISHRITNDRKRNRFISGEQFDALSHPVKMIMACDIDEGGMERRSQLGGDEMILWLYRKVIYEAAESLTDIYFISGSSTVDSFNMLIGIGVESADAAILELNELEAAVREFWSDNIRLEISFGMSTASSTGPFRLLEKEACSALLYRIHQNSGTYRFTSISAPLTPKYSKTQLQSAIEVGDAGNILSELKNGLLNIFDCEAASQIHSVEEMLQFLYAQLAHCYPTVSLPLFNRISKLTEMMLWSRTKDQFLQLFMHEMNGWLECVLPGHSEYGIVGLAKNIIHSRFSESLNISEVAAAVYVSPSHLSRLFRAQTNMTFLEYLTNVRVDEAKKRLADPKAKIYDISAQVGYSDWKYFSKVFKEITGYHPSDYRNRILAIPANEADN